MADIKKLATETADLALSNDGTEQMAVGHDLPAGQAACEAVIIMKTKNEVDENGTTLDNCSKHPDSDQAIVNQSSQQAPKLNHENIATETSDMACAGRSITFDPSLAKWDITGAEYRRINPTTHVLATGVAVVARSSTGEHQLLLVQRSPNDSYPNKWEVPGGSVDDNGETILEAAARELEEETGLTVSRFVGELSMTTFYTGRYSSRKWDKPTFVVQVAEAKIAETPLAEADQISAHVLLDANEHQGWVWATKDDIEQQLVGNTELYFVSEEQKAIMLEAFALRSTEKGP